jgi:hypothetical protein
MKKRDYEGRTLVGIRGWRREMKFEDMSDEEKR